MPSVADCLRASTELADTSDSARLDVEILLAHVLNKDRAWLYTWPEKQLSADAYFQFLQLISRRIMGEPIAYLVGQKGFWSLDLEVENTTLIPRPETELLVELALEVLTEDCVRILDLGTGTGAIALAIAKEKPQASVVAVDCVTQAVVLAKRNALRNKIENVEFLQSNWFENEKISTQKFDLIVSNPPYIDPDDPHLDEGDIRFEPKTALVANAQGYADLEGIIRTAKNFLLPSGYLMLEHGYQQGGKVQEFFAAHAYTDIATKVDLENRDRVSMGRIRAPLKPETSALNENLLHR